MVVNQWVRLVLSHGENSSHGQKTKTTVCCEKKMFCFAQMFGAEQLPLAASSILCALANALLFSIFLNRRDAPSSNNIKFNRFQLDSV